MRKLSRIIIYIFCILNSISGLQIRGISLNTIFVGLFAAYVFIAYLKHSDKTLVFGKKDYYAFYIISAGISCLFSLFNTYVLPHRAIVRSYLINCIIYFLIFIMLRNCKKTYKKEFCETFKDGLIYAARIQAVWGILQLILLYSLHININQILFVDILHSSNSRDWIMGFYNGNIWNMRITGLNFENSMFALVVCIGMVLENSLIFKILLMITAILSLSRTGWIMVAGYTCYLLFKWYKTHDKKISKNRFTRIAMTVILVVVTLAIVYSRSSAIQRQVANILIRLNDSTALTVSASRHILYYPYGIKLWASDANLLQKLFGYGMRCSGVAFSQNANAVASVGIREHFNSAWAVECDFIGLLLGGGLLTFYCYYAALFKVLRDKLNIYREVIFILLLGGLAYHYHSISYVVFILMCASIIPYENVEL